MVIAWGDSDESVFEAHDFDWSVGRLFGDNVSTQTGTGTAPTVEPAGRAEEEGVLDSAADEHDVDVGRQELEVHDELVQIPIPVLDVGVVVRLLPS